MLAIVYFVLAAIFGITLVNLTVTDVRRLFVACAPSKKAIADIPNTLFTVPAGILVGILITGFFNYFCILGLSRFLTDPGLCRRVSMLVTFAIMLWLILSILVIINRRRLSRLNSEAEQEIEPYTYKIKDTLFYGIVIAVITAVSSFLMLYTYRISGGELLAGFSTFSDLAPHTAMVSSFSNGFNFPTQYMHFSGDGIQYHFMFYFFCGMLNYGGLPIDAALNAASIVTMVCALTLLGLLAMLISGKKGAFAIAPLLVFFRSSWNVFDHLLLLMKDKTFFSSILAIGRFDAWYEVTPYDSWGIWAINVYPNQRHFMLGMGLIIMVVILFLPLMRRMCISCMRAGSFGGAIKAFLFSASSWVPRKEDSLNPLMLTVLTCITVIVMPYFHGSALIAMLLILFGMALFSESRLLHLIVAVCAVASSYIQTRVFSGDVSNVVSFKFAPGFIVENPSALTITKYLLIVTGLTLVLGLLFALFTCVKDIAGKKPIYRFLLFICFLFPLAFGFTFQVTLEMLANHKFIQVTLILVDAFVAVLLANLFAIPYKVAKKDAVEDIAVLPVTATDIGIRTPDVSAIKNLADELDESDDGSEELDLPEEIDLPDEVLPVEEEIPAEDTVGTRPGNLDSLPAAVRNSDIVISETSISDDEEDENTEDVEEPEEIVEEVSFEELDEENSEEEVSEEISEEKEEETSEEPTEEPAEETETKAAASTKRKNEISLPKFVALQLCGIILGIALLVPLTATGISEWCTYINLNKNHYVVNANSAMTKWIMENTDPSDVFLTPMWSLNSFYLAGRPSYYGWPYYAWSAGHDTDTRDQIYAWLISGCGGDINEFTRYCKERGIKYLIADPDFDNGEYAFGARFNWNFFAENLTQVASFNENGAKIYKIY